MKANNFLERVRRSTGDVVVAAQLVNYDWARLETLVSGYDPAQVRGRYTFQEDFHFTGGGEQLVNYVFTLDALNFGSGLSPRWKQLEAANLVQGSLYKTVADTLRRAVLAGNTLDAHWAGRVTAGTLAELFKIPADFPLLRMFARSLNELGRWVVTEYAGRYLNVLEASPTADALVANLALNLAYFNDSATYLAGPPFPENYAFPVYFYKRAQILANDLYLAFEGRSPAVFPDIDQLTMFADNLLPHYFRMEGVLRYTPELEDQIEQGEPLEAGSQAETEIRASGVQCVEVACRMLNRMHPAEQPIFPAMLDVYLWNFSQSPRIKARPRHRTVTYFY